MTEPVLSKVTSKVVEYFVAMLVDIQKIFKLLIIHSVRMINLCMAIIRLLTLKLSVSVNYVSLYLTYLNFTHFSPMHSFYNP